PKTGWPVPHSRFWIAMASPNVVLSQPRSSSMGSWKKPMAERGPKLMAAIRQPHNTISQGKDGAACRAEAALTMGYILMLGSRSLLHCVICSNELAERIIQ